MNYDNFEIMNHPMKQNGMQIRNTERVYMCGHLGEKKAMEDIGTIIQDMYVADIWISKGGEESFDEEELEVILKEMNLIVVLVSNVFLSENCAVGSRVLTAAKNIGIPILPIKMEEGIGRNFTEIYGSLHMINYCSQNFYNELKTHIENYIDLYYPVGNTDVSKENLFRFKIFISYRKKDLLYLKKILNVIRQWDEHIDTSVWYDEALIPGENYNEQIKKQLQEADLVLLIVTPNLLEVGNYVMQHEYPDAVGYGKKIIPVVMKETDNMELSRYYPQISDFISGENTTFLRERIYEIRKNYVEESGELSANTLYNLTLSYASGLKTVRDKNMAEKCQQMAAERGNLWARARLGRIMCERGQMKEALWWMEQAFDGLYMMVMKGDTDEKMVFSIQSTLGKLFHEMFPVYMRNSQYNEAMDFIVKVWKMLDYTREYGMVGSTELNYHVLMLSMGMVYFHVGNLEKADDLLAQAEKGLNGWKDAVPSASAHARLVDLYTYRGRILLFMIRYGYVHAVNVLEEARRYLEIAMEEMILMSEVLMTDSQMEPMVQILEAYHKLSSYYAYFCPNFGGLDVILQKETEFINYFSLHAEAEAIFLQHNDFPIDLQFENLQQMKDKLDINTLWHEIFVSQEELRNLFSFSGGFIPEGEFGEVEEQSVASAYKCPVCQKRMYKTVFPEGKDPVLYLGLDKMKSFSPARVFMCPCGRIYATRKGCKLVDGPVHSATLVGDKTNSMGITLFNIWWEYFNSIGSLTARRRE